MFLERPARSWHAAGHPLAFDVTSHLRKDSIGALITRIGFWAFFCITILRTIRKPLQYGTPQHELKKVHASARYHLPQDLDHNIITSVPVEVLKVPLARISRCSALSADLGIQPVGPETIRQRWYVVVQHIYIYKYKRLYKYENAYIHICIYVYMYVYAFC